MESTGIAIVFILAGLTIAVLGLRNAVEKAASKLERIADLLRQIRDNADG